MSITAYGSGAVRSRQKLVASVTDRWSGAVTAQRLLIPAGLAVVLILVYFVTHGKAKYAVIGVGLPVLVAVVSRSKGAGFLLAVGALLVIPYWYNHVWLIAPSVVLVGLMAGHARTQFHPIDLVFALVVLVFTASWLFHPELQIPSKQFLQGIFPFGFYLWARLSVDRKILPRLQLVMLSAGAVAALTVLLEAARGSALFVPPAIYEWSGSASSVFRPGGIFGGSPTAATVLAVILLASASAHRWYPKTGRFLGALIVLGIAATLDRAGVLGLIAGALLVAVLLPYRHWLRVAAVAVVLLATALVFINSPALTRNVAHSRLVTQGIVRSGTISVRETLLGESLPLVADSSSHLLFGRGFDSMESSSGQQDLHLAVTPDVVAHHGPNDEYLRALLEQGVIGLALILLWLGGSLFAGIRTCLQLPAGSRARLMIAGLSAGVLAYIVAATGHDMSHNIAVLSITSLVTGTLVSATLAVRRHGAAAFDSQRTRAYPSPSPRPRPAATTSPDSP